jgi:flagellar motor protein MotB
VVLLRGHVDNFLAESFRQKGEAAFRLATLRADQLSKERADEVRKQLLARHKVDAKRIEAEGRGWHEPVGADKEKNRRVEVQWFLIE